MTIVAMWDSSGGNVITMKCTNACTKHSPFTVMAWGANGSPTRIV